MRNDRVDDLMFINSNAMNGILLLKILELKTEIIVFRNQVENYCKELRGKIVTGFCLTVLV